MTVRKSLEQLAKRVPHGEKTTNRTSSLWSVKRTSILDGACVTFFSNSFFHVDEPPQRGLAQDELEVPGSDLSGQLSGGARKENRLFPAKDGFCLIAGVLVRLSCSHTALGAPKLESSSSS
mmetsp:Transcript_60118/g.131717  ORF Transcript_60118/g.131717 Transcript_60118/m.131717 type:complete len:121 (+) Transcript_60118:355-717(+)|eukprot:CAMPEP_0206610112 /NCGR_PEP_ID=MMETSP0325_2-20121206/54319_1 /ASSEMBLY_ACC=CAM_ASM_000347 /TAXON_ID=2866 /ORGANISM="Crypthecodinium cohnii, Strain Seligo" /LENGTH=120 /DNA_ID=CAMNT_0054128789 /DNA_START=329 /DNA_END=691 /DNA_ORIENTATION=+